MYAIIRTGGHQEKVNVGEQITVDHLKQAVGETLTFPLLMITKDDGTVVTDHKELEENGKVTATVVQHIKADKVDVFQYRNKTGYRRHTGHRQPMTLVEISEIRLGDEVATPPPPPAVEEPAAAETTEAAEPAKKPARKSTAKKAAPKKTTAKSTAKKAAPKKKK